jgi:16S rRNA (adenine1518-N6/adenine1519-N6)-dimethyltransferase
LRVDVTGPAFPADPARLFRLIKAGFGEKRKQLKNAFAGGLNLDGDYAAALLTKAKLESTARAQELDLAAWERLYQVAVKEDII